MRTFIGMFLGSLLTVGAVFVHDSMVSPTGSNGTGAEHPDMIVNWDVAARKWGRIRETAHSAWLKLRSIDSASSSRTIEG